MLGDAACIRELVGRKFRPSPSSLISSARLVFRYQWARELPIVRGVSRQHREAEALRRLEATLAEGGLHLTRRSRTGGADARCDDWWETVCYRDTSGGARLRSVHRNGCGLRAWERRGVGFVAYEGPIKWQQILDQARALARIANIPSGQVQRCHPDPRYRPEPPEAADPDSAPESGEVTSQLLSIAMQEIPGACRGSVRLYEKRGWRGVVTSEGSLAIRPLHAAQISLTIRVSAGQHEHVLPFTAAARSVREALARMLSQLRRFREEFYDCSSWGPLRPGIWPVVLSPHMSAALLHEALGHPSEADRASLDHLGQLPLGLQLAPPHLQVIDHAAPPDACGSFPFDDEGTPCRPAPLIEAGRWVGLLHSRATAHTMGVEPTGNARTTSFLHPPLCRMRVLGIAPGSSSLSDLLASIRTGYYLDLPSLGFLRGGGLAIHAAVVRYVEHGRKLYQVPGATLVAKPLSVLASIAGIAGDTTLCEELPWCTRDRQENLPTSHVAPSLLLSRIHLV